MTKYKYSLYDELLDEENILSHVFLNCARDFVQQIADKNEGLTDDEIRARKVEIELKIDGVECDPKKFFDVLYEQYAAQVGLAATRIVKEQLSDKFSEMSDALSTYADITKNWANDIEWTIDNPLKKKKGEAGSAESET